jgi:hypothetical protein
MTNLFDRLTRRSTLARAAGLVTLAASGAATGARAQGGSPTGQGSPFRDTAREGLGGPYSITRDTPRSSPVTSPNRGGRSVQCALP